jgi:hypothetical protein
VTRADNNHLLAVRVTGWANGYYSASRTSSSKLIANLIPLEAPLITGQATVGTVLRATPGAWDQEVSTSYQWFRDEVAIPGATSLNYKIQLADTTHRLSIREVASKTGFQSVTSFSQKTSTAFKGFTRLVAPIVRGKVAVGRALSTVVTPYGPGTSYTYQWLRDGVAIANATDRKYVLTAADLNSAVSFRVCGAKLLYETTCLDSSSSFVALGEIGTKPVVTLKFSSLKVGAVVTGKSLGWDSDARVSYQWLRDGLAIEGENSVTHQVMASDLGHDLVLRVTAQKTGYVDLVSYSASKKIS